MIPDLVARAKKWIAESTPRQKLFAVVLLFSIMATGALLMISDSTDSANSVGASPLYYFSVFVKLIGVLLLIVASAVLYRRWMPFGPGAGKRYQNLKVLETARLSPRQALHLVSIGEKRFLIGATDQAVSLISALDDVSQAAAAELIRSQAPGDFSAVLQSMTGTDPLLAETSSINVVGILEGKHDK